MPTSDPNAHFIALQNAVVARLLDPDARDAGNQPVPWPATDNGQAIPIISEVKGDIANQLEKTLNAFGVGVIVVTPLGQLRAPDIAALDLQSPLKIQVQENVNLNQSGAGYGTPALSIVALVLRRLHWWSHMLYAGNEKTQRVAAQANCFTLLADTPELIYDVDFFAPINLSATLVAA